MRRDLIDAQMVSRGVRDKRVLGAMERVDRARFVPEAWRVQADEDRALPLGSRQTVSQPYIVAKMTELVSPKRNERVLEVGTGSGYQTAVVSELAKHVYTVEIIPELAAGAKQVLDELGVNNVTMRVGDGHLGWPEVAPFDAVIVTAAPAYLPVRLVEQLRTGGRLVVPLGLDDQLLYLIEKTKYGVRKKPVTPVRFVPMTGRPDPVK